MPKKQQLTLQKMDGRVEALESELSEVRSSLVAVENAMKELPGALVAVLERSFGKSLHYSNESPSVQAGKKKDDPAVVGEEDIGDKSSGSGGSSTSGSQKNSDPLTEFRQSARKVELPSFEGEDPAGWISRAEVYFRVQGTTPEIKVNLAQLCMEGPTIDFFNSLIEEDHVLTWENLKEALLERYGGSGGGDVYEQLSELRQKGIVDGYITDFEYLIVQIPRLPEKQFQGYFLHGLNGEIKGRVMSLLAMGGVTRARMLQITRAVEKEVKGSSGSDYNCGPRNGPNRTGSQEGGRNGSDWVMVKGRDVGSGGGVKSGGSGLRNDKQAQDEK
jgi:hypothetical protein